MNWTRSNTLTDLQQEQLVSCYTHNTVKPLYTGHKTPANCEEGNIDLWGFHAEHSEHTQKLNRPQKINLINFLMSVEVDKGLNFLHEYQINLVSTYQLQA